MLKKLIGYMRGYIKESILGPLFKLLEATFELFVPLVIASMIDNGIRLENTGHIWKMGGVLLLLGVVGLAFSITAQYFAARAAVGTSAIIRRTLFERVTRLSAQQLDKNGVSGLTQRLTGDVDQVQNGINLTLRLLLRSPFVVFGAMIMAFFVDAGSAWIFAVAIPVLGALVFGVMAWSLPLFRRAQQAMDLAMGITRENLTGARVIRAFGREKEENERFTNQAETLSDRKRRAGHVSALTGPLTCVVVNLALAALIYTGALRVDSGIISQGELVALVNYMSQILVELIKFANLIVSITKAMACFGRVQAVIELNENAPGDEKGHVPFDNSDTVVKFDCVTFTYPGAGAPSIRDVSFEAKKGETIGIVGPTGSGKSTIVQLITRFYDATEGRISMYGKDVTALSSKEIRKRTGIVEQKTLLFSGSISDNIRWGKTDAGDDEITLALQNAQGLDIIKAKADGLDSQVGQSGRALSGGQKQRVAIARALIRKPEILILDDSASALDYATDARLRAAIRNMQGESTVFIISQRASSVRHADRILVMEEGYVKAMGTHDQLMKDSDLYREIYFSQFPEGEAYV